MPIAQGGHARSNYRSSRAASPFVLLPFISIFMLSLFFMVYFSPFRHALSAKADTFVTLPGHIPGLVKRSQLLGPADSNTPITVVIGLYLRHQADLEALVLAQAHTHHYLTPDQVAKSYAPLPTSERAVIDYMRQEGFTLNTTYRHHLLINFSGTIAEGESAFHVQMDNYRSPTGRRFYALSSNPSVPAALAGIIQSVAGLDTAAHYAHPPLPASRRLTSGAGGNSCPAASDMPHDYYTPSQVANAYDLSSLYHADFQGEGQIVGLFELDDYMQSDIAAYTSCYGGAAVPVNRVLVNGGTGQKMPGADAAEVELDMELTLSTAPHLAALRVYEALDDTAGVLSEWGQIVNDAVPVVSTSWGACEPGVTQVTAKAENELFMVAAAQGQSILAAAGDHGTDDCDDPKVSTTETVDDPASQPYVTSVGGTSLSLDANNNYSGEQAWNWGTSNGHFTGGGGGVSSFWTMPSWQQGPGVIDNAYSSTSVCANNTGNTGKYCREVPDVALDADSYHGYELYCTVVASLPCSSGTGPWISVAGTSAAAPMWAAMIALANQKSLHDGNFNLGFLNPLLYQVGQSQGGTSYANDFHDIQIGNNSAFGDGKYSAGANYDLTSGWGSYKAAALATDLEKLAASQTNARSAPASQTWYFAEGSVGNSFSEFLTLLNPSTTQVATVNITYLFEKQASVTRQHTLSPSTRSTVSANADLNISTSASQQAISAIVQANIPIVAERPIYFNLQGIASGTDALGATSATNTTFYFAEGDSRQDTTRSYYTFVTLLNPSSAQTAHVTVTYYSGGKVAGTQNVSVAPLHRGTAAPAAVGLHQQVAIKVTSDSGIVAERPMYFRDTIATAGGATTGAASVIGATATRSDWLFAEGYTGNGSNFQEYLVLANFSTSNAPTQVKLEYTNGSFQTLSITVPALSQYYFDVNNASTSPGACHCTPTADVSAEVTSTSTSLVAERLMYFHFGSERLSGGTDVVGKAGPSSHALYSFAEGFTYGSFSEFLTLQNPNNSTVTASITLFANNAIMQITKQLLPYSRTTVSVNSLIVPMASAYPTNPITQGYEVSMDVQAFGGTVVAERPMYFNFHGEIGGTDVVGYTGG